MKTAVKRTFYLPLKFPDIITNEEIAGCYDHHSAGIADIINVLELANDRATEVHCMTFLGTHRILLDGTSAYEYRLWTTIEAIAAIIKKRDDGFAVESGLLEKYRVDLERQYDKLIGAVIFGEL